jgi:hypothetical protein
MDALVMVMVSENCGPNHVVADSRRKNNLVCGNFSQDYKVSQPWL